MADVDGFYVHIPRPLYGIGGNLAGQAETTIYRMRAYDATLARVVYWNSSIIDTGGTDYAGPGGISDVVVSHVIGA